MIETIIKLDGTSEPFQASKPNRWMEWGTEHLKDKVDWTSIVLEATATLPKTVTSQDFQLHLIEIILAGRTWSHYLLAGRLYAVWLQKHLYGMAGTPTVKALHARMQKDDLMVKLNYTTQDYLKIEKFIDHSIDFEQPHFALHQIRKKYALANRVTGKEYESPQFTYMRMAMALSENEPKATRIQVVRDYYELFSRKQLSAPTPNYINLGTVHRGFASCCLFASGDNGTSLAIGNFIGDKMTQMSAGIGVNIMTRAVGDAVRNGLFLHHGKKKYYDSMGKSIVANTQAGRGGAVTCFFEAFDQEADMIQALRNPRSTEDRRNRDMHFAMLANSVFAQKAMKKEDIFAFNPHTAPDLHEAFYGKDIELFKTLYAKYEADVTFVKHWASARDVLRTSLVEAQETGVAYVGQIDEMNRHTPFKEPIRSSNLCVAPETKILTDRGYVEIQTVVNTKQNVWNGEEFSEVDVVKTGENQKLITVVTDSGQIIECTPYHKFYVVDGYGLAPREVRAGELQGGEKLIKCEMPVVWGTEVLDKAYINGFYSGDGCETKGNQRIYLYGEKMKLASEFGDVSWNHHKDQNRLVTEFIDLKDKFFVPDASYGVVSRLQWLAGYADADGTIYRNGENQQLVLSSVNYAFLKEIQLMLNTVGVSAKIKLAIEAKTQYLPLNDGSGDKGPFECQNLYRLIVSSGDLQKILELGIQFKRLVVVPHKPQREAKQFSKVVTVIDTDRYDDTYCFTEPKRHMGVFNGLLTGQCMEIAEPTAPYYDMMDLYSSEDHGRGEIATCSLAAVSIENIPDKETYQKVCYYALKMIDYCILNSSYVFPHLELTAKSRMSAGVGIMGLATHMAREGLKYSSDAGKQEIHFIAERHMFYLIEASLKISKERGLAPWMHKTLWPEGWLPIDTYKRSVDKIKKDGTNFDSYYKWEQLRTEIIANGGIGHSVLCAYMPGESSSKALGGCNGVYPARRLTLSKNDQNNLLYWAAPYGDDPTYNYELAWDIPTKDMIDCYAIIQKFCDQSISADLWRRIVGKEQIDSNELLKNYFYQVQMGMKTRYYFNTETTANLSLEAMESAHGNVTEDTDCASGACKM